MFSGHLQAIGNGVSSQSAMRPGSRAHQHHLQSGRSTASSTCMGTRPFAESALQWSSESTLGASELVRRNRHHQIHHHHYYHHHQVNQAEGGHQRSSSGGSAAVTTAAAVSKAAAARKTVHGMNGRSKDDLMLSTREYHRRQPAQESLSDSEDADICVYCSEWLSKALLCSCQVPSSSTNSSPSQSGAGLPQQAQPPQQAGKVYDQTLKRQAQLQMASAGDHRSSAAAMAASSSRH